MIKSDFSNWLNRLKLLYYDFYFRLIASAFPNATVTDDFLLRIITMCEDRLHVLPEILEYGSIYLQGVDFSSEKVIAARSKAIGENSIKILEKVLALTTEISESDFTAEYFKTFLKELPKTLESTSKEVLSPLRFVLSGQSSGTPLEEILSVLGILYISVNFDFI